MIIPLLSNFAVFSLGCLTSVLLYHKKVKQYLFNKTQDLEVELIKTKNRLTVSRAWYDDVCKKLANEREITNQSNKDYKILEKEFTSFKEEQLLLSKKNNLVSIATQTDSVTTEQLLNSQAHALVIVNNYLVNVIEQLQKDLTQIKTGYKKELETLSMDEFITELFFNYHHNNAVVANLFQKSMALLSSNQTHTLKSIDELSLGINSIFMSNMEYVKQIDNLNKDIAKKKKALDTLTCKEEETELQFLQRYGAATEQVKELEIQLFTYFTLLTNSLKSLGPKIEGISKEWQLINLDINKYVKGDWDNYITTMQYYQKYSYALSMFLQNKTPYADKNLERPNTEFWDHLSKYGVVMPQFIAKNIMDANNITCKPSIAPWMLEIILRPTNTFYGDADNKISHNVSGAVFPVKFTKGAKKGYISRDLLYTKLEDDLKRAEILLNNQKGQINNLVTENTNLKDIILKTAAKEASKEIPNHHEITYEQKISELKESLRLAGLDVAKERDLNNELKEENNNLKEENKTLKTELAKLKANNNLSSAFEEISIYWELEAYSTLFLIMTPLLFWSIRLIIHFGIYWYNYGPLIILTMDKGKNLIKIR